MVAIYPRSERASSRWELGHGHWMDLLCRESQMEGNRAQDIMKEMFISVHVNTSIIFRIRSNIFTIRVMSEPLRLVCKAPFLRAPLSLAVKSSPPSKNLGKVKPMVETPSSNTQNPHLHLPVSVHNGVHFADADFSSLTFSFISSLASRSARI